MIFFTDDIGEDYGTELLDEKGQFVKNTVYEDNCGYMFFTDDSELTFHSYTKVCDKPRYSLMYNVYTEDGFWHMYDGSGDSNPLSRFNMIGKVRCKNIMDTTLFNISDVLQRK